MKTFLNIIVILTACIGLMASIVSIKANQLNFEKNIISIIGADKYNKMNVNKKTNISNYIIKLNEMEDFTKEFQKFLESQKTIITTQSEEISMLRNESESLKEIIEIDSKKRDALYYQFEKYNKKNSVISTIISFIVGVLTSMIGSFFFKKLFNKKV